jgi:hypothetical protein
MKEKGIKQKGIKQKAGLALFASLMLLPIVALAGPMTGEGPNLGNNRITMQDITGGNLTLKQIQDAGLRVFMTPFNRHDGYGDGPLDPSEGDPRMLGNRPSLQGNGTFLRVNGLDAQTCLECHFITRNSTIPATLGIGGGIAGVANNVIFMPSFIDVAGSNPGEFNGRFINPPFLFGSGGLELVGREMTVELQKLKADAIAMPGTPVTLIANGVNFGTIVADASGHLDTTGVEGINEDLVVRPFGRKGDFFTDRDFDRAALQFHFGMQPVEVAGEDNDADGDGIVNEVLVGEVSALHIFTTTRSKPIIEKPTPEAVTGFKTFTGIGCVDCHKPFFITKSRILTYSYPEEATDPGAHIYYRVDLTKTANFLPASCIDAPGDGIIVLSFSDLKRHNMGPDLAESFDLAGDKTNREFITARLWGVRDTAPYLHDGRATTITDAILKHGGEAQDKRDRFDALPQEAKDKLIAFLYSLRTPLDCKNNDGKNCKQNDGKKDDRGDNTRLTGAPDSWENALFFSAPE